MMDSVRTEARSLAAVVAGAAALALVQPCVASAATAVVGGGKLYYRAAAGEVNDVTLDETERGRPSGPLLRLGDGGANIEPGAGCARASRKIVTCGLAGLRRIVIRAGDRDDRIIDNTGLAATLVGGAGDDMVLGGSGPDVIWGGTGRDRLNGRSGDDQIHTRGSFADAVTCGPGLDAVWVDPLDRFTHDCESIAR